MPSERLIVWKHHGVPGCQDLGGHDSRHESVWRLVKQAVATHEIPDFSHIVISTADRPVSGALCFSTCETATTVPDFLFDSWPEVGIADYETTCGEVAAAGEYPARQMVCGWIGNANTSPVRHALLAVAARSELLEARHTPWPPERAERLTLAEQVAEWGLLLDVEGNGWSARLKLLLWSGRPVLLVDRPWREFFFPYLRAWQHFIPVRRDLVDLEDRVAWAVANPDCAARIGAEGQRFAREWLTRERALDVWAEVLGRRT